EAGRRPFPSIPLSSCAPARQVHTAERMKTKDEIICNWLPRYTGLPLENFGRFILLTNFARYLQIFAAQNNVEIVGADRPMPSATARNITMINFTMGSANAATIMDL